MTILEIYDFWILGLEIGTILVLNWDYNFKDESVLDKSVSSEFHQI